MKINKLEARASQDITIDELPKQDSPNNSDLLVIQSSSLTEATSIQQLRNKILSGSDSSTSNLGEYVFTSALTANNSLHLMDGSIGYKDQFQEFYAWLLIQVNSVKTFYSLDTAAETFIFPLINNRNLKINTAITNYTGGISTGLANHTHRVEGEYQNGFWIHQQSTPPNLTSQRRVLVQIDNTTLGKTSGPRDSANAQPLTTGEQSYISSYMYVRVSSASNILASKSILANGTVSMDLGYNPTDINDVATKKYIDNKFLNYEIPLSFSINEIGKRIPYYKNADQNPTLIALDGTKYLIADYPDFDYTQEGFTNDGVYFWFVNIELEIKSFQNEIQPSSEWFPIPCYAERIKGQTLSGNFEFKSKMIYNFLNSPQGAGYLFTNANDNQGFTILNPTEYLIRANYNNWGMFSDSEMPPTQKMYKFKLNKTTLLADNGSSGAYKLGATLNPSSPTGFIGATGEVSYLKIKPDYMVAKIQQVGSVAGAGDLKSDRSVDVIGLGEANSNQVASMKDLKDSNIIVGNSARVITTLDSKLNQIDTNIETINNNIGVVDISGLQTQVDTNTTDITSVESNITTLQTQTNTNTNDVTGLQNQVNTNTANIATLQSSIPTFKIAQSRRLVKPNTNIIEIAGQGRLFPIDSFIPTTTTGYESETFTIETFNGKKVIKEKMENGIVTRHLNIRLSLGHTATMTSKKIELAVYLFRGSQTGLDDNSAIATGSSMLFYDTDARGQSTNLLSVVVNGANDSFVTEGFFIVLKSLNPSADKLIFSKGDILINIVNSN